MRSVDQRRHDSDRTADKAAYPDPAAPGTDAAWGAESKPDAPAAHKRPDAPVYSAQDVRQGEIILKRPWQRAVFILGLAGAVLLALFFRFGAP
jgi:hypothetical protein